MAGARRRCRQEWRELSERWRGSKLTGAEFARREGLNVNTFAWWRSELARERPASGLSLVPVRVDPPARIREPIEVMLPGQIRLLVPDSADPERVVVLISGLLGL